ncbi:hypothetical protein EYF80_064798 [Liparis tanakae]|uniref:Uncharacterized protein n=1 Tax=Liparis tanakae TaxID=230148 RepID=A0A4Z2E8I6_9TELE|nr:hypothetical protein EYF80_064798 [Liparis tanakae]
MNTLRTRRLPEPEPVPRSQRPGLQWRRQVEQTGGADRCSRQGEQTGGADRWSRQV